MNKTNKHRKSAPRNATPLLRERPDAIYRVPQIVVLSSNFTIGPLLARGALLPDALEGDAISVTNAPLRLQWCAGSLHEQWVESLVSSARNVIPIAIRLSPGRNVRTIVLAERDAQIECICLSDVADLIFRDDRERIRFSSMEFGNYDLGSHNFKLLTDANVFSGADNKRATVVTSALSAQSAPHTQAAAAPQNPVPIPAELITTVRTADCRNGLLTFLLTGSPGKRVWMQGVERLFSKRSKGSATDSWAERIVIAAVNDLMEVKTADDALLGAVIEVIRRYPVEDGWPAEQVLAEVTEIARIRGATLEEHDIRELTRWSERAADVLASKSEPQSLADDAFILQRAILLLLLRGDLDAIVQGNHLPEAHLRPGPQVFGIASALAAYRMGLRAMPARYKTSSDPQERGRLLTYLGEAFTGTLQEMSQQSFLPSSVNIPVVSYRSARTLQGEWILTVSSQEIARTVAEFDRGLERLLTMGRHLGFEFEEHGNDGLVTHVPQTDGRRRPVYLDLLHGNRGVSGVVRFSSPTLKLVGINSRSRLPKEFLLNLLARNSSPDMNCRFAIVDGENVIVALVDQLLGTLDEAEFKQHIQHVAQVADEFELSRDIGKLSAS